MKVNLAHIVRDFSKWLEINPLSGNATLLYVRLLFLFNDVGKKDKWPDVIRLNNSQIMVLAKVETETTARRAREELVKAGLIQYERGYKKVPGTYRLIYPFPNTR